MRPLVFTCKTLLILASFSGFALAAQSTVRAQRAPATAVTAASSEKFQSLYDCNDRLWGDFPETPLNAHIKDRPDAYYIAFPRAIVELQCESPKGRDFQSAYGAAKASDPTHPDWKIIFSREFMIQMQTSGLKEPLALNCVWRLDRHGQSHGTFLSRKKPSKSAILPKMQIDSSGVGRKVLIANLHRNLHDRIVFSLSDHKPISAFSFHACSAIPELKPFVEANRKAFAVAQPAPTSKPAPAKASAQKKR